MFPRPCLGVAQDTFLQLLAIESRFSNTQNLALLTELRHMQITHDLAYTPKLLSQERDP